MLSVRKVCNKIQEALYQSVRVTWAFYLQSNLYIFLKILLNFELRCISLNKIQTRQFSSNGNKAACTVCLTQWGAGRLTYVLGDSRSRWLTARSTAGCGSPRRSSKSRGSTTQPRDAAVMSPLVRLTTPLATARHVCKKQKRCGCGFGKNTTSLI
jgi:hypothetical protein